MKTQYSKEIAMSYPVFTQECYGNLGKGVGGGIITIVYILKHM